MLQSASRWFKNLVAAPARVLSVLESVHSLDMVVDDLYKRICKIEEDVRKVEQDVLNLPVAQPTDLTPIHRRIDAVHRHIDALTFVTGGLKCTQQPNRVEKLADAEFKVFSQFGDDGIIEYLVSTLNIENHRFIEFGVESYMESNTRFLLQNRNWSGLIMDGSEDNISWIRRQDYYWRHDLTAVCAFIDAGNINQLIAENGFAGPIGLLSVDIDGNDYWVWRAITAVDPIIVVSEYNSTFGDSQPVTIPYSPDFQRTKAHHSNLYWGSSLAALCSLAKEKGYSFVGCNSAGNNAYFVRNSHMVAPLKALTPQEGFVASKFRESRAEDGTLTFASKGQRREIIADMQVFDISNLKMTPVKSLTH
jgi:hypothetical protein